MTKQYLIAVDEIGMALLQNMVPKMQFISVEGMITDSSTHFILATPKPVATMDQLPEIIDSLAAANAPVVVEDMLQKQDDLRAVNDTLPLVDDCCAGMP